MRPFGLALRSQRRRASRWLAPLLACLLLALAIGCLPPITTPPAAPSPTAAAPTAAPAAATAAATAAVPATPDTPRREIVVIHTNDEHGYLTPKEEGGFYLGGASLASASWRARGLRPTDEGGNVLLLSGGDNLTGPAISTWFQGESAIEAMNAMGYRASVIGNHEFDFGREALARRIAQAHFPYLAANLTGGGGSEAPPIEGVLPYVILPVGDVRVGVVGLALEDTPLVTAAKNLTGLHFGPYEPALRRWVPEARAAGAEVIIVLSHAPWEDLASVAKDVADLDVALFLGGHSHQSRASRVGAAFVATMAPHWRQYLTVRLTYDRARGAVVAMDDAAIDVLAMVDAEGGLAPDPIVARVVDRWQRRADLVLGEAIGYTARGLDARSERMHALLLSSWLWAYPEADLAMSNTGGFRQGIDAGAITVGDVVGVLPFENVLYEIEVTGEEVRRAFRDAPEALIVGGEAWGRDGSTLDPSARYRLLVTDYLYDNQKYPLRRFDATPYDTSISWRQPVIDWIRAQRSTEDAPLEERLR